MLQDEQGLRKERSSQGVLLKEMKNSGHRSMSLPSTNILDHVHVRVRSLCDHRVCVIWAIDVGRPDTLHAPGIRVCMITALPEENDPVCKAIVRVSELRSQPASRDPALYAGGKEN